MNLTKLRSYRIFGIALFDLIIAIIGTILILLLARFKWFSNLSITPFVLAGILLTIPLGIFFHIIFGVNTTLNYRLRLSNKP